MGRLSMFLEGFQAGTRVQLLSRNRKLIFDGVKEDVPHRFEDQVNIILGQTSINDNIVIIVINYDDEEM
ncbi:MAG: hypothetical protein IK123_04035 [Lachnospiraceae bacterium]|nr:hypothetical protein [Lachnospiraceae bacterium]